jgi:hypothetical protein
MLEEKNRNFAEVIDSNYDFGNNNKTSDFYFGSILIIELEQKIDILIQENERLNQKI